MALDEKTEQSESGKIRKALRYSTICVLAVIAVWCLVQAGYLQYAVWFQADPSSTAELTSLQSHGFFEVGQPQKADFFEESLAEHLASFILLITGLFASVLLSAYFYLIRQSNRSTTKVPWNYESDASNGVEPEILMLDNLGQRLGKFGILLIIMMILGPGALGTAIGFWGTTNRVFVDVPEETVVVRQIHLLPKGIYEQKIPFIQIANVRGEFRLSSADPDYYRYQIIAVIDDQQEVVMILGPEQPASASTEPDPPTIAFAESFAAETGAELHLTSSIVNPMCKFLK